MTRYGLVSLVLLAIVTAVACAPTAVRTPPPATATEEAQRSMEADTTTQALAVLDVSNPFAAESPLPYGLPPFDRIADDHYLPAHLAGMAAQRAEVAAIRDNPAPPTFENTIVALERSGALLERAGRVFRNLNAAHTNPTLQEVARTLAPLMSAHGDAIYLDDALFARIDRVFGERQALGLDPESLRLVERTHTDFVRAGARLVPAAKERLKALNAELASLATAFTQNVLAETNDLAVIVEHVDELDGLSDAEKEAAAAAANAAGHGGKYLLALQNTTLQPLLTRLTHRALRERIHRASVSRCARDNAHDNRPVLARMAVLRAERAELLGYATAAHYILEDQTAVTPAAVNAMLERLVAPALANAQREAGEIQAMIKAEGGTFELQPWDWLFYAERVRKARYDLDGAALKPYFELNRVLQDGVFFAAQELFGLRFVERTDLPVYHPDVRVFEVFEEGGASVGLFLGDFWARPSKRGGAWMNQYVMQSHLLQKRPVVGNHLNIPKPPAGEPTLLTMDEVTTLFHEFGHALHGLLSDVRYPRFSGTTVPRDFVEYPSQVFEMWALWPAVLANYARHYETGAPIPAELVAKVKAAETFNQGFATTEYVAAALLDQAYHQLAAGDVVAEVAAFEARVLQAAGAAFAPVPPRYLSTYFSHVFAGGYAAGYYAYVWAEVLDADSVAWFGENGGLTRENGQRLRDAVLSRGGSDDAMVLYREFAGREPSIDHLLRRRGLLAQ